MKRIMNVTLPLEKVYVYSIAAKSLVGQKTCDTSHERDVLVVRVTIGPTACKAQFLILPGLKSCAVVK